MAGWFQISGTQNGVRSLTEQLVGLDRLFEKVRGADVLDLGCAEGLISRILLSDKVARRVLAVDSDARMVGVARNQLQGYPGSKVVEMDLNVADPLAFYRQGMGDPHVVLALSVLQKVKDPEYLVGLAASLRPSLVVARTPGLTFNIKHGSRVLFDLTVVMRAFGFGMEYSIDGPHGSVVTYWRNKNVYEP